MTKTNAQNYATSFGDDSPSDSVKRDGCQLSCEMIIASN